MEAVVPDLLSRLASAVLDSPTHELRWLAAVRDQVGSSSTAYTNVRACSCLRDWLMHFIIALC